MTRVLTGEIKPGAVFRLDDLKLREESDCLSSGWLDGNIHNVIEGPHFFLILQEIEAEDVWLATPMRSRDGPNRTMLDDNLKQGFVDHWSQAPSYYYQREFWKLTVRAIVRASEDDQSPMNNRKIYSNHNNGLEEAIEWSDRNQNDFIVVGPKS